MAYAPGMTSIDDERLRAKINSIVIDGFKKRRLDTCVQQWTGDRVDHATEDYSMGSVRLRGRSYNGAQEREQDIASVGRQPAS